MEPSSLPAEAKLPLAGRKVADFSPGQVAMISMDPYALYNRRHPTTNTEREEVQLDMRVEQARGIVEKANFFMRNVNWFFSAFDLFLRTYGYRHRRRRPRGGEQQPPPPALRVEELYSNDDDDDRHAILMVARMNFLILEKVAKTYLMLWVLADKHQVFFLDPSTWNDLCSVAPILNTTEVYNEWMAIGSALFPSDSPSVLTASAHQDSQWDVLRQTGDRHGLGMLHHFEREADQTPGRPPTSLTKLLRMFTSQQMSDGLPILDMQQLQMAVRVVATAGAAPTERADDALNTYWAWNAWSKRFFERDAYFSDRYLDHGFAKVVASNSGHFRDYATLWSDSVTRSYYMVLLYELDGGGGGGTPLIRVVRVRHDSSSGGGDVQITEIANLNLAPQSHNGTIADYEWLRVATMMSTFPNDRRGPVPIAFSTHALPVIWQIRRAQVVTEDRVDFVVNTQRGEEMFSLERTGPGGGGGMREPTQHRLTSQSLVHQNEFPIRVECTKNYVGVLYSRAPYTVTTTTIDDTDGPRQGEQSGGYVSISFRLLRRRRQQQQPGSSSRHHELEEVHSFENLNENTLRIRRDMLRQVMGGAANSDNPTFVNSMIVRMHEEDQHGGGDVICHYTVNLAYQTVMVGSTATTPEYFHVSNAHHSVRQVLVDSLCAGMYVCYKNYRQPDNNNTRNMPAAVFDHALPLIVTYVKFADERVSVLHENGRNKATYPFGTAYHVQLLFRDEETDPAFEADVQKYMPMLGREVADPNNVAGWRNLRGHGTSGPRFMHTWFGQIYPEAQSSALNPINNGFSFVLTHSNHYLLTVDCSRTTVFVWQLWPTTTEQDGAAYANRSHRVLPHLFTVLHLPFPADVLRFSDDDLHLVAFSRGQGNRWVIRWRVKNDRFLEYRALRDIDHNNNPEPPQGGGGEEEEEEEEEGGEEEEEESHSRKRSHRPRPPSRRRARRSPPPPPPSPSRGSKLPSDLIAFASSFIWNDLQLWGTSSSSARRQ